MILGVRHWPVIATLIVVAAAGVMVMLGFWQLDRLAEKEAMIARYTAAIKDQSVLPSLPDSPIDYLYRRVNYTCTRSLDWWSIAGRSSEGEAGYVKIENCGDADVVIGWFGMSTHDAVWGGGNITGIIAPGGDRGWRIVSEIPYGRYRRATTPNPSDIPNNHLAYAVQWFIFAAIALVIYVLALRRKQREG